MEDMTTDDKPAFDSDALINWIKCAAATVDTAVDRLSAIRPTSNPAETAATVEAAICHLSTAYWLLKDLVGVQCPHCSHHMHMYTDGRAIAASVKFLEGSRYTHISHPDPSHQHNKPRELATLTTRNGTRKRIVLSAPGHLDAFTVETEEA
jgi:hypothetical protein